MYVTWDLQWSGGICVMGGRALNLSSRHTTDRHVPPVHPAMNEYISGVSWGANYGSFLFNSWTSGTHANYITMRR